MPQRFACGFDRGDDAGCYCLGGFSGEIGPDVGKIGFGRLRETKR